MTSASEMVAKIKASIAGPVGPGDRRGIGDRRRTDYCDGSCGCQGGAVAAQCRVKHSAMPGCAACMASWRPSAPRRRRGPDIIPRHSRDARDPTDEGPA